MLPISLLVDPGLTDCDIRILLVLDMLGWREGQRDGVIRATNEEIGKRAGKNARTVVACLRRLSGITPPLIERDMVTANTRDAIRLAYDRCGGLGFGTQISAYQVRENLHTTPHLNGEVRNIYHTPPIREEEVEVAVSEVRENLRTTSQITQSARLNLAELLAWLPCISEDQDVLKQLRRLCPMWFDWIARRCPEHAPSAPEWIQDAILSSSEADDIALYARKLLKLWVGAGGRPEVELAPKPMAVPDETDTVAPPRPAAYPPRTAKADRAAAVAANNEALLKMFAPKEALDGPR